MGRVRTFAAFAGRFSRLGGNFSRDLEKYDNRITIMLEVRSYDSASLFSPPENIRSGPAFALARKFESDNNGNVTARRTKFLAYVSARVRSRE